MRDGCETEKIGFFSITWYENVWPNEKIGHSWTVFITESDMGTDSHNQIIASHAIN